jgi:hypothetical protein
MYAYFIDIVLIFLLIGLVLLILWKKKIPENLLLLSSIFFGITLFITTLLHFYPYYETLIFTSTIQNNSLYKLIAKKNPEEYNWFINQVKTNILLGKDPQQVQAYSSDLVNRIYFSYLQTAPDAEIFSYVNNTRDFYQYLYHTKPQLIVDLELGRNLNPDAFDENDIGFAKTILKSKKQIIEAAAKAPQEIPPSKQVTLYLEPIVVRLEKKYGIQDTKLFFSGKLSSLPPKVASAIIMDFYNEIVAQGQKPAGAIFRYIASQSKNKQW